MKLLPVVNFIFIVGFSVLLGVCGHFVGNWQYWALLGYFVSYGLTNFAEGTEKA